MRVGLLRSLAQTFAVFLGALLSVWVVYALLHGLEPIFDAVVFGRLLITAPVTTEIVAWKLMAREVVQLCGLALPFLFLRHRALFMASFAFFFLVLVSYVIAHPPPGLSSWQLFDTVVRYSWIGLALRLSPYALLVCVGVWAALGLTSVGRRAETSIKRGFVSSLESGPSAQSPAFLRVASFLAVSVIVFRIFLGDQREVTASVERSPAETGVSRTAEQNNAELHNVATVMLVVPGLDLTSLRKAVTVSLSSAVLQWLTQSQTVHGHVPQVPLARPMRFELLGGRLPLDSGVHGNLGALPQLMTFVDLEQQAASRLGVGLVSLAAPHEAHALWFGAVPMVGWTDEFVRLARFAINPLFAQVKNDQGAGGQPLSAQAETGAQSGPFGRLRRGAAHLGQRRFQGLDPFARPLPTADASPLIVLELPQFPAESAAQVQGDYFDQVLSLVQGLQEDGFKTSRMTLLGLPAEQFLEQEAESPLDLGGRVRRATGVVISWRSDVIHSRHDGSGHQPSRSARSFEDRLRDVEDGRGMVPTACVRRLIRHERAALRPAQECLGRKGIVMLWPTSASALMPTSALRRFLRLTRPMSMAAWQREGLGAAAWIDSWPDRGYVFRPGEEWLPEQDLGLADRAAAELSRDGFSMLELGPHRFLVVGFGAVP